MRSQNMKIMETPVSQSNLSRSTRCSQIKRIVFQSSPWLFLTLGVLVRIFHYLNNRSLWQDEAKLALNILDKSFYELLYPLDYNQGAPVLFLWLEKICVTLFGPSELALRFLPFLSSFIGLVIFYKIAKQLFDNKFLLLSLFLFVFSYQLVYYSHEVKQYSFDVTVSLTLIYLVIRFQPFERPRIRTFFLLSMAGGIALWLSHASLFILPGIGILFALRCFQERSNTSLIGLTMVTIFWLLNFVVLYSISLKSLEGNRFMLAFWQRGFIPPPTSLQNVEIILRRLIQFINYSGFSHNWLYLVVLLFLIGSIEMIVSKRSESLVLLLPFCFTLVASSLHKYAFINRLVLFLVPFFYIFIVYGLFVFGRKKKSYVVVILIFLTMVPFIKTGFKLTTPITREEVRPLLAHLMLNRKGNDIVYVSAVLWPVVKYYHRRMSFDYEDWIRVESPGKNPSQWNEVINSVSKHPRVWFLISHIPSDDEAHLLSDIYGNRNEEIHLDGASLYFFSFE